MTRVPLPTIVLLAMLASFGLACASDSEAVMLPLLFPEDGAVLSLEDDVDARMRGLQVDIRAESDRIGADTPIELVIDDRPAPDTALAVDGGIEISNVTLPPGRHTVQVRTTSGSVASDKHEYVYRALVIDSPQDGQPLGPADDRDAREDGIQIRVDVDVFEIDRDEDIVLLVDDAQVGDAVKASAAGRAVFSGVTLESGPHTLIANVGGGDPVDSEPVGVSVSTL